MRVARSTQISGMVLKLRKALFPLHFMSKVFCIGPFSLQKLQSSKSGTIITLCQAIAYTIFHLWMSDDDMSAESRNMVRQLIDSYNRYSGFCAFCFLVVASTLVQKKIVRVIQNIEEIDWIFEQKLNVTVDNQKWRRFETRRIWIYCDFNWFYSLFHSNRKISLQICLCISAISFFEWRNCLMYIQDSVPFSEYCLIMCLGLVYTEFR